MNFIKTTIATAAVITCCLGNEMPANASYEFAGGALYATTCAYQRGVISQSEAKHLFRKTLREKGLPMFYANHPKTIEASQGVFLVMGGC